jgi:hypothetical protein
LAFPEPQAPSLAMPVMTIPSNTGGPSLTAM